MARLALGCAAAAWIGTAAAAGQARSEGAVPVVEVLGAPQPRDEKPYRDLLAALDAVERHRALAPAAADGATVRFNRKVGSLAWRAEVRSPGVPDHARRLGDLMLECAADVKGDLFAYLHHPVNVLLSKLDDPCASRKRYRLPWRVCVIEPGAIRIDRRNRLSSELFQ